MNQQPEALWLADRNGNLIQQLRRTPMPLADLIPHLQAMGDELRRLHEENEALRKDAERYRFLRDSQEGKSVRIMFRNEWDAAIDAALKGKS